MPTVACCSRHIIQKFWNFNDCSHTVHDSDREEFSGLAVITSTTAASASARGSPECDDCQKTADFFSCLSISELCLKAVIDFLVQQKVPETVVSEIVRPSPEAAELLSVSTPLAAAATRVRVIPLETW